MKLLITGINGWIGSALAIQARRQGHEVRGTSRSAQGPDMVSTGDIDEHTDWKPALTRREAVVHLAARVHVMNDHASDPLAAFRVVNTQGTLALARQAATAGVRRFVFVSTVKVNGEHTLPGRPFRHDDAPAPSDTYGISKLEAEDGLRALAAATGMEVVIVRPPLVYGQGARANFAAMMAAVRRDLPLPLGSVTHNSRSLIALDNLVDLLTLCIDHPAAAQQTFLVSDGEDLSTAELLRRLGSAMGRPTRLLPCPPTLLAFGATLLGRRSIAQRLLANLQVDISHTRNTLGWEPPISVDEGLRRAAGVSRTA